MKVFLLLLSGMICTAQSADILDLVKTLDQNDMLRFEKIVPTALEANAAREDNNKTILMYACWIGNGDAVRYLVERGADVNAADSGGATALHLAIWKNRTKIALYLIEHGASTRIMSAEGMTPLDIAAMRQNTEVLQAIENASPPLKALPLN